MLPLSSIALPPIRLIATDMDGTLTQNGKFTPALLQALADLQRAEIMVLIVTGRSAGWVSGVVEYLPVAGAIAENGGLFFLGQNAAPEWLVPIDDLLEHRRKLAQMFRDLQRVYPQIHESIDNCFRLTDWTFDVQGLSTDTLADMAKQCQVNGWGFTYSTVQCHIKLMQQDKAMGIAQVLQTFFPEYAIEQVVTVGDSPNDESMFDANQFPWSIGVANILHYSNQLTHKPTYVTRSAEVAGFCEMVNQVLKR